VQDADRVADIEALTLPAGHCRACVDVKPALLFSQRFTRHGRHCGRRWHVGQRSPIRLQENELPIGLSFDLKTLFVNRTMMSPTQHREIRQLCRAAMGQCRMWCP